MSNDQSFRYSWIKVTDENGRSAQMRAALEVHQQLLEQRRTAEAGSKEARFLHSQLVMARQYLAGDIDHSIRVIIFPPPMGASLSLDLLLDSDQRVSRNGIEVAMATMPSGYSREDAIAWLDTPVGAAWSRSALTCRLSYAVVSTEEAPSMVAPSEQAHEI